MPEIGEGRLQAFQGAVIAEQDKVLDTVINEGLEGAHKELGFASRAAEGMWREVQGLRPPER